MPAAPKGANWAGGFWLDAGALLLVGGLASVTWALRRANEPAIPIGDAEIAASLSYSTN
jgi:hypothetical protein